MVTKATEERRRLALSRAGRSSIEEGRSMLLRRSRLLPTRSSVLPRCSSPWPPRRSVKLPRWSIVLPRLSGSVLPMCSSMLPRGRRLLGLLVRSADVGPIGPPSFGICALLSRLLQALGWRVCARLSCILR